MVKKKDPKIGLFISVYLAKKKVIQVEFEVSNFFTFVCRKEWPSTLTFACC
jgi:hypothetical protein